MHTNVHCSTVYNCKDLEPTQMPIDDRLNRENVAHTHQGILCSHKKEQDHVLCRDMDIAGSRHPQQTNTWTENHQTPHVLINKWELNIESTWTQRGEQHTAGPIGGWKLSRGNLEDRAIDAAKKKLTEKMVTKTKDSFLLAYLKWLF